MERNTIIAIVLSLVILIAWQVLFVAPRQRQVMEEQAKQAELAKPQTPISSEQTLSVPAQPQGSPDILSPDVGQRQFNKEAPKVIIDTPLLHVTLTTQGARGSSAAAATPSTRPIWRSST